MGSLVATYLEQQQLNIKKLESPIEVYQRQISINGDRPDLLKYINDLLKNSSNFSVILKPHQPNTLSENKDQLTISFIKLSLVG